MAEPIEIPQVDKTSIIRTTSQPSNASKRRSSRNSIKHGIFSDATLLPSESRARYQSLLADLQETLQPEGKLEEMLVEKLATLAWRQRRLLVAENAEIRKNAEFLESDQRTKECEEAEKMGTSGILEYNSGLIRKVRNSEIAGRCVDLLVELREGIKADGFDEECDHSILTKIYGESSSADEVRESKPRYFETLPNAYSIWSLTSQASEEQRKSGEFETPEQCKQIVLDLIDAEIRRLKHNEKVRMSIERQRTELEVLRESVPNSPGADRLIRYEASLERSFDRTLNQLERMQRLRRGQPVAPRIDVTVSK